MSGTRGTTNGNARGSVYNRRQRRAWLVLTYASDVPGFVRCYRCGCLLFNPDKAIPREVLDRAGAVRLTVDRIVPGCQGGTYRRENIRPACGPCNSETGGGVRSR
jgi:hypothetical protein